MIRKQTLLASLLTFGLALPAFAQDIMVTDSYARSASPVAKTGAAFLVIENHGTDDDRLIGVKSDAAKKVELHTHIENADGVMQMRPVEGGFALPGEGMIMMKRGGEHVMFMGLTGPFVQGEEIPLTLIFEKAGEVEVSVPVDQDRKDGHDMGHKHNAAD